MSTILGAIFTQPVSMQSWQHLMLLWPLCLSISVVYKTTKLDNVRDIPLASTVLWVTIVLGMYSVGVVLWLVYLLLV